MFSRRYVNKIIIYGLISESNLNSQKRGIPLSDKKITILK